MESLKTAATLLAMIAGMVYLLATDQEARKEYEIENAEVEK